MSRDTVVMNVLVTVALGPRDLQACSAPGSVPGSGRGRRGGCPHGAHSWVGGKVGHGETDVNEMPSRVMKAGCIDSHSWGHREGFWGL